MRRERVAEIDERASDGGAGSSAYAWTALVRHVAVGFAMLLCFLTVACGSVRRPVDLVVGMGVDDLGLGRETYERSGAVLVEAWAPTSWRRFRPLVGVQANTDGSVYGYGGVLCDLPVGRRWMVTPSLAVGGYVTGGGRDLGHVGEFRSAIQVSYRLPTGGRLGVQVQHISNANLGRDENPGEESLFVTWSPRLGRRVAGQ